MHLTCEAEQNAHPQMNKVHIVQQKSSPEILPNQDPESHPTTPQQTVSTDKYYIPIHNAI